jgi:hypothetical protein
LPFVTGEVRGGVSAFRKHFVLNSCVLYTDRQLLIRGSELRVEWVRGKGNETKRAASKNDHTTARKTHDSVVCMGTKKAVFFLEILII